MKYEVTLKQLIISLLLEGQFANDPIWRPETNTQGSEVILPHFMKYEATLK